jgi:uncharacterized protein YcbK (DUF882 family)
VSHAGKRVGLAALLVIAGSNATHNAVANGDTRTISFHHLHTGEDLTVTFKRNGRYDDAALKKIDWLMRDWRQNQEIRMDPQLIDLMWEVHREVGSKAALQIVCGYRAPVTNAMLRRRSSGVAQQSQHTVGKAIDFYIPDAKLEDLRATGLRLQRGGVGFYPGSGWPFVHMDVGSVRHWPRMTHDQLAKVFPDGRTVHVPSDGQPLKGYALALADLEKRGGAPSATSLDAARTAGVNTEKRTTLANLFGFGKKRDKDEDEEADIPARAPQAVASAAPAAPTAPAANTGRQNIFAWNAGPQPAAQAAAPAAPVAQAQAPVPMPKAKPAAPVQVAAAPAQPAARPAQPGSLYTVASVAPSNNPNDVITSRGYWQGAPEAPIETSAARRMDTASADPQVAAVAARPPVITGSVGPWTKDMPGDVATAFAPASEPKAEAKAEPRPARAAPVGTATSNAIPRNTAAAAGTTVALKAMPQRPSEIQAVLPASLPVTGRAADEPWLRAIIATPSVQAYMTITLLGAADMRILQPLLRKPAAVLTTMTFSADPHAGMSHSRFEGPAIVFLASVTDHRAAMVR